VGLRDHVGDLVEGASDEIHELKFGHRAHAGEGSAKGGSDDGGFRDGVSMTRSGPKRSMKPSVTLKAPP